MDFAVTVEGAEGVDTVDFVLASSRGGVACVFDTEAVAGTTAAWTMLVCVEALGDGAETVVALAAFGES